MPARCAAALRVAQHVSRAVFGKHQLSAVKVAEQSDVDARISATIRIGAGRRLERRGGAARRQRRYFRSGRGRLGISRARYKCRLWSRTIQYHKFLLIKFGVQRERGEALTIPQRGILLKRLAFHHAHFFGVRACVLARAHPLLLVLINARAFADVLERAFRKRLAVVLDAADTVADAGARIAIVEALFLIDAFASNLVEIHPFQHRDAETVGGGEEEGRCTKLARVTCRIRAFATARFRVRIDAETIRVAGLARQTIAVRDATALWYLALLAQTRRHALGARPRRRAVLQIEARERRRRTRLRGHVRDLCVHLACELQRERRVVRRDRALAQHVRRCGVREHQGE